MLSPVMGEARHFRGRNPIVDSCRLICLLGELPSSWQLEAADTWKHEGLWTAHNWHFTLSYFVFILNLHAFFVGVFLV